MNRSGFWQSFFMEMAMVILFFSIALAVIVRLFSQGAILSEQSKDMSGAILAAQTVAQTLEKSETDQTYTLYYDENWNETWENPYYAIQVDVQAAPNGSNVLCRYSIEVYQYRQDRPLFQLQSQKYFRQEDGL